MNIKNSARRAAAKVKKGFTLIEILIVVAIIGLLAALGVSAVKGYHEYSVKQGCEHNVGVVNSQLQIFEGKGGKYGTGANQIDKSSVTNLINSLNTGVTVRGLPVRTEVTKFTAASYTVVTNADGSVRLAVVASPEDI